MSFLFLAMMAYGFAGGDFVGNGASLSENRILMASENLETYLIASLRDKKNPLQKQERDLISKILKSVPQERIQNPRLIEFEPQSDRFFIEGHFKVAATELVPGSTIYFNQDLLQRLDDQNKMVELSMMEAISLLVHEFGHHQGITDHTYLDLLGAKVGDHSRFQEYWIPLFLNDPSIGAQFVAPLIPWSGSTSLQFADSSKHWDVQSEVHNLDLCRNYLVGSKTMNLTFWNLYWTHPPGGWAVFHGKLAFQCVLPNGEEISRIGDRITITIPLTEQKSHKVFGFEKRSINIEECDAEKGECEILPHFKFIHQAIEAQL